MISGTLLWGMLVIGFIVQGFWVFVYLTDTFRCKSDKFIYIIMNIPLTLMMLFISYRLITGNNS